MTTIKIQLTRPDGIIKVDDAVIYINESNLFSIQRFENGRPVALVTWDEIEALLDGKLTK